MALDGDGMGWDGWRPRRSPYYDDGDTHRHIHTYIHNHTYIYNHHHTTHKLLTAGAAAGLLHGADEALHGALALEGAQAGRVGRRDVHHQVVGVRPQLHHA